MVNIAVSYAVIDSLLHSREIGGKPPQIASIPYEMYSTLSKQKRQVFYKGTRKVIFRKKNHTEQVHVISTFYLFHLFCSGVNR